RGKPYPHYLLWQGTPGGRLRQHFLLVAEPPRRHGAERRRKLSGLICFENAGGGLQGRLFCVTRNKIWPNSAVLIKGPRSTIRPSERAKGEETRHVPENLPRWHRGATDHAVGGRTCARRRSKRPGVDCSARDRLFDAVAAPARCNTACPPRRPGAICPGDGPARGAA